MGWPAANFTKRSFADLAGDMAALIRALNQRREAVGSTTVDFAYNGGTKAYPSAAELSGWSLFGTDFQDNMKDLQTEAAFLFFITNVTWYETSGFSTQWTFASIIADIGLGSFDSDPQPSDADYWERLREYFDRLIYPNVIHAATSGDGSSDRRIDTGSTLEIAWDNAITATPTSTIFHTISYNYTLSVSTYTVTILDNATSSINLTNIDGTILGTPFIRYSHRGSGTDSQSVTTDVGTFTATTTSSTSDLDWGGLTLGITNTIDHNWTSTPSDHPFTGGSGSSLQAGGSGGVLVHINIDISSALTDQ